MEYLSTVRRWSCQKKFSYNKVGLENITCFTSFDKYNSFSSHDILKCHSFLENITGQKPYISKNNSGYVGSTKYYSVTNKVTLRKKKMYNFIKYLRCTAVPMNIRLSGLSRNLSALSSMFEYSFINWSFFYGQSFYNLDTNIVLRLIFKGKPFFFRELLYLYRLI